MPEMSLKVGVPGGQTVFVFVDEDDTVGAPGPVALGIEQQPGEGAGQGGRSAAGE
ncbi:hypothetical protein R4P64_32800 [Rhodococcus sp. IEGM 1366]|uniref:hypothetical protein n=2 Tax=Rhodococcus TaxID=1827 RepID=UPI0029545101|nr:hypothetical protein [Rhodococcus sp. IEGM 1366]MCE4265258.1 hypothetical protein [Rhodococcus globerulus]MDV8071296.1 hypothetical protein [Rhodococcus sp. IEGM 1366]